MHLRSIMAVALVGAMLGGLGCAQTVDVRFEAPPGSVMTLEGQRHELPEMLSLQVPTDNFLWDGPNARRSDVYFEFPLNGEGEEGEETLLAEGVLDVFKFTPTDVDRYARNRCPIEPQHIQRMRDGYAVVIDGYSASGRPIFKLTMGER